MLKADITTDTNQFWEKDTEDQLSKILADGQSIIKDIKDGRAWRFECPRDELDLEYQIYFKSKFSDLIVDKKIGKLVKELEAVLSSDKFHGSFKIDVIPEAQVVVIHQQGFWKDFRTDPNDFAEAVEAICEKVL